MIRFDNFKEQYAALQPEVDEAVLRVLKSGWYIMGKELTSFEEEFARYLGAPTALKPGRSPFLAKPGDDPLETFCVGVASGTDAITLALVALGIGEGDEVITTGMTAFPSVVGIMRAGAVPVIADISYEDGLIDANEIEKRISSKTRAIMPVHLYGQSCDMNALCQLAEKHGLFLVEDCAQSAGAVFGHRKTGVLGDIAAFSFYPTKNLGAYGDAGAVVTNNKEVYDRLLKLRNYGQSKRYYHDEWGMNSRLDEVQAAILKVKLKYLDEWNEKRREHAAFYQTHLTSVTCLRENPGADPIYHLFVVKTPKRDALLAHLENNGIKALIHYPVPMYRQKGFISKCPLQQEIDFKNTDRFADEILSIPIYPELSEANRQKIVDVINEFEA